MKHFKIIQTLLMFNSRESGRAGRDGDPSDCILLYHYRDYCRVLQLIRFSSGRNKDLAKRETKLATVMKDFCDNKVRISC